jgi:exopolysaccharide biosynthesis protein
MRVCTRLAAAWLLSLAVVVAAQSTLPRPEQIADGVQLYRLNDPALLDPPGPVAVQALRLDPREVTIEIARGQEADPRETVETMAARRPGAIAAVNAGFFSLKTGRPTDFLKIDDVVVNDTTRPRGAVGILEQNSVTRLLFDRVTVNTRASGPPNYQTLLGSSPRDWARAQDAVSGAGLLMLDGRVLTDWTEERITAGFETTRHPRTIVGTDAEGAIWLVTVDGRNPLLSLGMSFTELQRLANRLALRSALNLDGGGSTTMWVDGKIVNHPSDPEGPRAVSDAILVVPRP